MFAACGSSDTPVDDRNSLMMQGNVQMNVDFEKTTKSSDFGVVWSPQIYNTRIFGRGGLDIPEVCASDTIELQSWRLEYHLRQ